MKFYKIIGLFLIGMAVMACSADPVDAEDEGANQLTKFTDLMLNNPHFRNNVSNEYWSSDPDSAPTDAELTTMLQTALLPGSAHMLTPVHFVVIRDYKEQKKILSGMKGMVSPGTVAVMILSDVLRDSEHHKEEYNDWYQQMYYGIMDAGYSLGYLNIAALSLGYRTHCYAFLNLPVDGSVDFANGGSFDLIQGNNWDITPYLTSKDGSQSFVHTVGANAMGEHGPVSKDISADGNLSLLAIMVIGKIDADKIDSVSSATNSLRPQNFNFWDPQDNESFGNVGGMEPIDSVDALSSASESEE